ncbi:MAG TPA: class I SAM-dependent methyltransferase [Gemmatimonadales bacterium]|nr:class I SAM-dependent methyltransferase [Gemmatimonadales bacterium]
MSIARGYLNQFRTPSGWFGKFNLWMMNRRHSRLTDWGLSHVTISRDATILDVGCGGGRTVAKLASIATQGRVYGVDVSEASVAMSRSLNRRLVAQGRVDIRQSGVSRLPFPDRTFDLVTAVETHFYWPDLANDVREVLRVLEPGGTFVVIAEAYKGGKHARAMDLFAEAMKPLGYSHLDVADHHDLLANAGFADVDVVEDFDRGWICAVGKRPQQ